MVHRYDQSLLLSQRAQNLLPCEGAQTLSKSPSRHPRGAYPVYITEGNGAWVVDLDGNRYIDYTLGLGPVVLGYNYPSVTHAVTEQVKKGAVFSLEHPLTVEVAELLLELYPSAEMVRYMKGGGEANSAACRVARVVTGHTRIAVHGYHGHQLEFQVHEPERGRAGVPVGLTDAMVPFQYNDLASLKAVFAAHPNDIAAVLLEPARTFEPEPGFLEGVRKLCDQHSAVLIYDEVVTGCRWAVGGAQERYGVTPDLTVLGKACGNGYAFGAVIGKRVIMDAFNHCFVSGTYFGDAVSLAAVKATLTVIRDEPVTEHLWQQGSKHRQAFDNVMASLGVPAKAVGVDVCWLYGFEGEHANILKSLYLQEMAARQVLPGGIAYISYSHGDKEIGHTIEAMGFAAETLRKALESGKPETFLQGKAIGFDTYKPPTKPKKDSAKGV